MINSTAISTTAIQLILETPKYYNQFRRIQSVLVRTTLPFIFIIACVGLITNTATIVLLSKSFVTKNTRHKWTLIALAVSDLVHNSALSIRVIHDITKEKMEYLCIIISFLSQLAELLSAGYTVLFTAQRYRAVRYPLEAAVHNRSSPLVIIFLIFLSSLSFCFALLRASVYVNCHEELELSWFIADALFSFIIPFSLILLFNIRIVRLIKQHARSSISKQSIMLRPQKLHRSKRDYRSNRQEESQSIIYSAGNSLALNGTVSEIEMDTKFSFNTSVPQKKNKSNHKSLSENQASEISAPLTQIEEINVQISPLGSPRHSVKSQNSGKKKTFSRQESQRSNELDAGSNNNSHSLQSVRVTRMLILVSTCFLVLNAPAHLSIIAMKIYIGIGSQVFHEHAELDRFQQTKNLTGHQLKHFVFIQANNETTMQNGQLASHDMEIIEDNIFIHLFYIAIQITQWISYVSYSINFFLYSFSGITFRSSLRQLWNKLRKC